MRLPLNLDKQLIVNSGGGDELSTISGKRSSAAIIAVPVWQNGAQVEEAVTDLEIKCTIKDVGEYDDDPLATTTAFVFSTDREQYEAQVSFITAELNERFGAQGDPIAITGVAATDLVTAAGHGLVAGDLIWFSDLSGGAGITEGEATKYYVIASGLTTDDFKFSATLGGAAFDFTSNIVSGNVRRDPEDVDSIELAVELAYRYDTGDDWTSTENSVLLTLNNNYIRDDDGAPSDPLTSAQMDWLDDNAVLHSQAQSLSAGSKTQALDNLGVSTFVQTILDDANAAAVRTTIGALGSGANSIAGVQTFTDTTEATTPTVAAATFAGGVGVAKDLRVADDVFVGDALSVTGQATVGGALSAGSLQGKFVIPGHLFGLILSNNASDATNDIDISAGSCTTHVSLLNSGTTLETYLVTGTITKRLDAAWAAGTGNGGLDQGTIANATYHVHMITGASGTDAIFSLSHDRDSVVTMSIASPCVVTWGSAGKGHGLVAGSPVKFGGDVPTGVVAGTQYYVIAAGLTETQFQFSATNGGAAVNSSGAPVGAQYGIAGPQLPAGYTYFRRIGSIIRASAAILPFIQDGDRFYHLAPVLDVSAVATGTSAQTKTLTVPTGIIVEAFGATNFSTAIIWYGSPLLTTDVASAIANGGVGAVNGTLFPGIMTNSLGQIRSRSSGAANMTLTTHGWIDKRGRED